MEGLGIKERMKEEMKGDKKEGKIEILISCCWEVEVDDIVM